MKSIIIMYYSEIPKNNILLQEPPMDDIKWLFEASKITDYTFVKSELIFRDFQTQKFKLYYVHNH